MDIEINTFTLDKRRRNYCFQIRSLEEGLEMLQQMLAQGDILLEAVLVDDQQTCLQLPVEAFDGGGFIEPLSQLQQEWELILETHLRSRTS